MNKTRQADTSLQAYFDKKDSGELETDREKVLKIVVNEGPITCKDVAGIMGKRVNDISGRFTELLDNGKIGIAGHENGHRLYEAVVQP